MTSKTKKTDNPTRCAPSPLFKGNPTPQWAASFLPLFRDTAHKNGKASLFWAQAYLESPKQVERGFHPGDIGNLVHTTIGAGVDGMLLWHYRGFSQKDYGWNEFFQEFATAAATYKDRPAVGVTFSLKSDASGAAFKLNDLGNGKYQLLFQGKKPGEYTIEARNRAGVIQPITLKVR